MSLDSKQRLSALTDEQKRLLAQRLSRRRPSAATTIPRQDPAQAVFPLSFAQQRFWFLTQLGGSNASYNISEIHRLKGPLDLAALDNTLNEMIRRHSVLRTTFEVADGVPQQRIAPTLRIPLPVEDLSELPPADRNAQRMAGLYAEARRPWSLTAGPVIRARVWRLAEDDHQLMVLMHHIVSDGWSQGLFVRELAALYDAYSNRRPSPLPELPIQYSDFAVWQRQWATSPEFDRQMDYWKAALQDPPVLQLPAIRSATSTPEPGRGTHKRFFLSRELSRDLRTLCQAEGVTVYMAMLAAFAILLFRYSGQDDVVIGSPIANRDRPEVEGLIGSFMNPLPIRTDLRGNPSFRELLARVRKSALGVFANQNVPFDVLVRTLQGRREGAGPPLFQAMFLLQNFGLQSLQLSTAGLAAKAYGALDGITLPDDFEYSGDLMYPVALEILEIDTILGGVIEFAPEFAATLSGFPDHLRTLIAAALAAPDRRIGELPLLTSGERARLLVEWNHETHQFPAPCAHRLFEAEAAAHPDATAVVCGTERLSYAELNRRANDIARVLVSRRAGREIPVGILLERSVDMVAAVLGVMKAGSAYVPLDPAYPMDRLRFVARDSQLRVLITSEALRDRVPELLQDRDGPAFDTVVLSNVAAIAHAADVDGGAHPSSLAYVIYTSGSTGLPKGTMVTHGSLSNAYHAWESAYRLRDLRVHLQMASLSFDVCTGDIVRAMCSGATLVVVPQELLLAPSKLYDLMRAEQVDAAEFVPVVLRALVSHVESSGESLSFMRLLAAGSDSWYMHEYERILRLCGDDTRLVNSYGLTESTIDSTYFDGAGSVGADDGLVPLGRAFVNTEVLLLDRHLQLVPVGVPAELCVGGPALARGYWQRPSLTAERFVPHPFSTVPGARLYRTGDLARYLPDGTLELLGRIDNQIKLRGFRIELAEIEAVLRTHEAVREAAVVVREDQPGDRRLVAYISAAAGAAVPVDQLRTLVRETLPDYMMPSAIVTLPALPVTANGKIDRAALPAPDGGRQLEQVFVAPSTALERRVAAVWRDVLRVTEVGINDNFFDLGGHSLLLVQLHARLVETLELEISVLDLFRFPTISTLANHLTEPLPQTRPFAAVQGRADRRRAAIQRKRQPGPARQTRLEP